MKSLMINRHPWGTEISAFWLMPFQIKSKSRTRFHSPDGAAFNALQNADPAEGPPLAEVPSNSAPAAAKSQAQEVPAARVRPAEGGDGTVGSAGSRPSLPARPGAEAGKNAACRADRRRSAGANRRRSGSGNRSRSDSGLCRPAQHRHPWCRRSQRCCSWRLPRRRRGQRHREHGQGGPKPRARAFRRQQTS